ncbi:MAG: ABC transporter, partial [Pyrinomonadaceae bacterium]|nr:ABC transporter [Pyrinomonadaceae bacterium]
MQNVDDAKFKADDAPYFKFPAFRIPFFKRRVALAWRQLFHERQRLFAAILGILFADVLMFMQFGFEGALFDLCRTIPKNLQADIVIINKQTQTISLQPQPFSRRNLYAAMNNENIASGQSLYLASTPWKNPENGVERSILVVGFEPYEPLLNVEGVAEQLPKMRQTDDVLFGRYSRPEFGNVADFLEKGERYFVEVNRRKMQVTGLAKIGASFANDGTIITSDLNFLRIFPTRKPEQIDVATLRIKDGADVKQVKAELEKSLSSDLRVLTKAEFGDFEQDYWTG